MSDSENEVVEKEEEQKVEVPPPRKRYQSTKGENDKRKTTSKANMEKARLAKLANMKRVKEIANSQYEIPDGDSDSESESSSSEEELVISKVKKNKHKKKIHTSPVRGVPESRIDRLEAMMMNLAKSQKKAKKKVIERKTIVQLPSYNPQQNVNDSIADHYKMKLLKL